MASTGTAKSAGGFLLGDPEKRGLDQALFPKDGAQLKVGFHVSLGLLYWTEM